MIEMIHKAICDTIKARMPQIQTCESYVSGRQVIKAPAVLLELSNFEQGSDPATNELALKLQFEVYVIVDSVIDNAAMIVRKLAADLALLMHQNTWGLNVLPAKFLSGVPNAFKPELDAYQVWTLSFQQECHVGQSVWASDGIPPHEIIIGEPNES